VEHWRFATEEKALISADTIYLMFCSYLADNDFVGADMAKKFLHMGFTRARRYANHSSGKKYSSDGILEQEPNALNNEKARAADVFKLFWDEARQNPQYLKLKEEFKKKV